MIQFFTDLPKDVQLSFLFGIKVLIHEGKHYSYLGQADNEAARYEVLDMSEAKVVDLNALIGSVHDEPEKYSLPYIHAVKSLHRLCSEARYSVEQGRLCLANAFTLAEKIHQEQRKLLPEAETTHPSVFVPRHTK